MKVVQFSEFNAFVEVVNKDKPRSVAAIIEVNGTRFYSQPPRNEEERDTINSNLKQYVEQNPPLQAS